MRITDPALYFRPQSRWSRENATRVHDLNVSEVRATAAGGGTLFVRADGTPFYDTELGLIVRLPERYIEPAARRMAGDGNCAIASLWRKSSPQGDGAGE